MKKLILIVGLVFLVAATGVYAAPNSSNQGDSQAYTSIVPSMAAITVWVADFTTSYNENGIYQAVAEIFEYIIGYVTEGSSASLCPWRR